MHAMNHVDGGSVNRAWVRRCAWAVVSATLLTCSGCSDDSSNPFPPDGGGNSGRSNGGGGASAGASAHGGSAGHGGSARSGAPGVGGSSDGGNTAASGMGNDSSGGTDAGGASGICGSAGASGYSGSSGTSGAAGSSGYSGASGTSGASGSSGYAGTSGALGASGYAGTSGVSGVGGYSGASGASGSSGSSAASGASGANGGSSASGASGANGGSSASGASGTAGTSMGGTAAGGAATGGASAAGAPSGGAGGSGGAQGSFTLSTTSLTFYDSCALPPQSFTITNTSNIALTWHASANQSWAVPTPSGSTLAPGQAVEVSVNVHSSALQASTVIHIDTTAAPSQTVQVSTFYIVYPAPTSLPPNVEFGNVPIGTTVTAGVDAFAVAMSYTGLAAGFSGAHAPDIQFPTGAPTQQPGGVFGWTVTFTPHSLGEQSGTIDFIDIFKGTCPPNTITVHGVGVAP